MTEEQRKRATPVPQFGLRELISIKNFRLLWTGQVISNFGDYLARLGLLLIVNQLTNSTAALATLLIVIAIPQITIGMMAGVFVDRIDRRRIMLVSDLFRGVIVLGFILVDSPEKIWLLYVIAFLDSTVATFFTPARLAIIPTIVPEEGLLGANSVSETSKIIFNLLGTAAAGVIVGLLDIYWPVFLLDSLTFLLSFIFVSQIRVPKFETKENDKPSVRVMFTELIDGIRITVKTRVLIGVMVGAVVTMLGFGAVTVLLVPLLVNDLRVPETWFAGLELAQTASMILSGGLVAILSSRFKPTHIAAISLFGLGVSISLVSQVNSVWHMVLLLFVAGWFITPVQAGLTTLLQSAVSDDLRGRTGAARTTLMSLANMLSMAGAGLLGDYLGIRNVFILSGVIVMVAALVSTWIFRGHKIDTTAATT